MITPYIFFLFLSHACKHKSNFGRRGRVPKSTSNCAVLVSSINSKGTKAHESTLQLFLLLVQTYSSACCGIMEIPEGKQVWFQPVG